MDAYIDDYDYNTDIRDERKTKIKKVMKPYFHQTLFYFDIETTTKYKNVDEFLSNDERGYELFKTKWEKHKWFPTLEESYTGRAPLMHEYNKIINISFGYYVKDDFRIKSIFDDDEETIINKVDKILTNAHVENFPLCGYNIKGFDIPLLNRKYYKYGIKIPSNLETYGKKPWELNSVDLFEVWKSTGSDYISFDEVCYSLDVESAKSKMSGKDVYDKFWVQNDLKSITEYCEGELISMSKVSEKLFKFKKR